MGYYRKRPIVIEAFCYGKEGMPDWFMDKVSSNEIILRGVYKEPICCEIKTKEGIMKAQVGDFIIKGIKGEIYPCKPDIFEKSYEKVFKG